MTAAKAKSIGGKILRAILWIVCIIVAAFAIFLIVMSVTEYKPAALEKAELSNTTATAPTKTVSAGDSFTIMTWNIGYGALGDNADFFMDGGTMVRTADKARVQQNMNAITEFFKSTSPDIAIFQEVDQDSDRSEHIDESVLLKEASAASAMGAAQTMFGTNYKTLMVPLGWPLYGSIDGGIMSFSTFAVDAAERVSLPNSYSWPMSLFQLKRCELITRIPVQGTDKQLVIINQHPDAYTDEAHHAMQVAAILETLKTEAAKGNYVISGGDWNHTFSNIDVSAYPLLPTTEWEAGHINIEDFGEGWQFVMDNSEPTCRLLDHPLVNADGTPSDLPIQYYMIDGFIVSSNVRVDTVKTHNLGFVNSDHNPVVMRVTLQ
ncbi:MAG: hypothetical protein IJJ32_05335 [Eggerthellaceae bacterium]|nr:hypothetical protein [Eggerthellaceae bacterium]